MSENLRVRLDDDAGRIGPPLISGQGRAQAVRARFNALRIRTLCKATVLAAMIVATGMAIAVGERVTHTETHAVRGAIESEQDCSAKYAALLDLAELARRDGKSSEVVVRGLSDRGGAMSDCLPIGRRDGAR